MYDESTSSTTEAYIKNISDHPPRHRTTSQTQHDPNESTHLSSNKIDTYFSDDKVIIPNIQNVSFIHYSRFVYFGTTFCVRFTL